MAIQFECSNNKIKLLHDGMLVRESSRSSEKFQMHGSKFLAMLSGTKVEDIPSNIHFYISGLPADFSPAVAVSLDNSGSGIDLLLQLESTNLDEWDKPYSYGSYVNYLDYLLEEKSEPIKRYSKHDSTESPYFSSLGITFHLDDGDVIDSILSYAKQISIAQQEAHASLAGHELKDLIVKFFDFPDRYSTVCTQYILWFGELLKRIGFEAHLSTKESSAGVLLSIEHQGGQELTTKIEQLLYGYLSLPYSEYLPRDITTDDQGRMDFIFLKNQVEQFKFNLAQTKSELELQCMINNALYLELNKKEDELILLKAAQNSKIEILGGALALEKFKLFGVTVNPKKIYELLKPQESQEPQKKE